MHIVLKIGWSLAKNSCRCPKHHDGNMTDLLKNVIEWAAKYWMSALEQVCLLVAMHVFPLVMSQWHHQRDSELNSWPSCNLKLSCALVMKWWCIIKFLNFPKPWAHTLYITCSCMLINLLSLKMSLNYLKIDHCRCIEQVFPSKIQSWKSGECIAPLRYIACSWHNVDVTPCSLCLTKLITQLRALISGYLFFLGGRGMGVGEGGGSCDSLL